ncbi:MAG TPA: Lrp/AsnC family transcriptional regulator [Streptosporangiaceae bacterium]|jgi:Lrp/AsnC family transcriptional regulator for asnA, asnC and gidA|nr:Lrp/AsnC family transcriptional regulator [Streptosporangiaceae bacterium]
MSTPPRTPRRSLSAAPAADTEATREESAATDNQVTGGHVALGPVVRTTAGGRSRGQLIDEIDRRVIKILQADGRRPNTEIARDLHVSETTIRKRVSQLVSQGLINIVAVPTPRAVGLNLSAIIGISVTLPKLKEISEELKRQKEVRYVGVSTGRYDIIVEAFFLDQQHFLDFISSKLSSMEGITGLETSMILDVVKFSYEWEIA